MKKILFSLVLVFFLNISLTAQIIAFEASPTDGCPPLDVTFINISDIGTTFVWDFDDGTPVDSSFTPPPHTFLFSGTYNITLTVFDDLSNLLGSYVLPVVVTDVAPAPSFNFFAETMCTNEMIQFNYLGNPNDSILWYFGDGSTSNSAVTLHSYNATGIYQVALILTDNCGISSFSTQTVEITDTIIPSIPFFYVYPDTICPNDEFSSSYFGGWKDNLLWEFGDGNTSNERSPDYAYAATGAYTITLTHSNACGNTSTFTQDVVVSNSVIPETPNFEADPESICLGDSAVFYPYDYSNSYLWQFADGTSETFMYGYHSFTANGTFDVTLTQTNGCGNSSSFSKGFTVGNVLPPEPSFYKSHSTACPGEEVYFRNGNIASSYVWNFSDGTILTSEDVSKAFSPAGVYTVTLTTTNLCGNSNYHIDSVRIDSSSVPSFYIDHSTNKLCIGDTNEYICTYPSAESYFWSFGDGETDTVQNPKHVYQSSGYYYVSVTVTNNCGNSASLGAWVTVYGSGLPIDGGLSYEMPPSGVLTNCVPVEFYASGYMEYMWDFGDGESSVSKYPSHLYDSFGVYDVVLTITNGCGSVEVHTDVVDIESCIIDKTVETVSLHNVIVYPNPVTYELVIEGLIEGKQQVLTLRNMLGQTIYSSAIGNDKAIVNVTDFSPGIYLLEIELQREIIMKEKIIISP